MCGAIDRVLADTELRQARSNFQEDSHNMSSDWLELKVRWLQLQRLSRAFSAGPPKEQRSCIGARASKGLHMHSLSTAIPVAATAPASPFARPRPRPLPRAAYLQPSTRGEKEKEKTKRSTRFPNGRLLLETTTCSSSTRYAHIRLARTRKASDRRHSTGGGAPGPCACLADFPVGGV